MKNSSSFFAAKVSSPSTTSPFPSSTLQYSSLWLWYCRLSCWFASTVIIFTVVFSLCVSRSKRPQGLVSVCVSFIVFYPINEFVVGFVKK